MWLIFFQILTIDTPYLACEGEVWSIICVSNSDLYSALVNTVVCEICYAGPYNGTRLYQVYKGWLFLLGWVGAVVEGTEWYILK